jgi:putative transposase
MTNIRRFHLKNATVFMTAVCQNRNRYLAGLEAKTLLMDILSEVSLEKGFSIIGYVLMDDHFHWMIDLSGNPSGTLTYKEKRWNISEIMQSVKLRFTRRLIKSGKLQTGTNLSCHASGVTPPKMKMALIDSKAYFRINVWQRRFWDHIICDQEDFNRHLDYLHYNPVKHGYTILPKEYPWSSFERYYAENYYPANWGEADLGNIKEMEFE